MMRVEKMPAEEAQVEEAAVRLARRVIGDAVGRQYADAVLDALVKAGVTLTLSREHMLKQFEKIRNGGYFDR